MWVAITAACITSSMFLSALAPNLLALGIVNSVTGINISWGTWFIAFLPVGLLLLLTMPLLAYWFYPPEVKINDEVPAGRPLNWRNWAKCPVMKSCCWYSCAVRWQCGFSQPASLNRQWPHCWSWY